VKFLIFMVVDIYPITALHNDRMIHFHEYHCQLFFYKYKCRCYNYELTLWQYHCCVWEIYHQFHLNFHFIKGIIEFYLRITCMDKGGGSILSVTAQYTVFTITSGTGTPCILLSKQTIRENLHLSGYSHAISPVEIQSARI